MGNFFSLTDRRQKSLEIRLIEQEHCIRNLAELFKAFLIELRNNKCPNEEGMIRYLDDQIESQLETTQNLDKDVHEFAQGVIAAKTNAQENYDAIYQEYQELVTKFEVVKKDQENVDKNIQKLYIEMDVEKENLEILKQENRRLIENSRVITKNLGIVSESLPGLGTNVNGSIIARAAAATLAFVGMDFPSLEPVAFPFTVQAGAALIMKNMETSEEKLQSLRKNILQLAVEFDLLNDENYILKCKIEYKTFELTMFERNLNEAKRSMNECMAMQTTTNLWVSMLNRWLNFLIHITPKADRHKSHLGNIEAFQLALDDLTMNINNLFGRDVEEQLEKLNKEQSDDEQFKKY